MTNELFDEGGTARDYDLPVSADNLGSGAGIGGGWGANAPDGYTLGLYRNDAWAGGQDVRAYLQAGSYVRVRDISLSYEAPKGWAQALGGRTVRLTFQARNPFMFNILINSSS